MHINKNGYKAFGIHENGKNTTIRLHRALAICFIPNPNNLPMVNHKDGCKTNNNLDNLEWVTAQQNVQHAWDNGLNNATQERMVICLETGAVYKSARDAADTLNYWSPSAITACCKGKRKTAVKGWHWKYYQPTELVKDLIEAGFKRYPKDDSEEERTCYLALAQKWLREEKGIFVYIDVPWKTDDGLGWSYFCCNKPMTEEDKEVCFASGEDFSSFEEALSEGINEAVKILKEN